jgi:hypothetical protein
MSSFWESFYVIFCTLFKRLINESLTLFLFFQMPVLNASSSQGASAGASASASASAGATSSQGGPSSASSRGKFEKKCTKV